jgi:hypothetical protein
MCIFKKGFNKMKIIQESSLFEEVSYRKDFEWKEGGGGFSFPCNKDGVISSDIHSLALENYQKCISGEYAVIDQGISVITSVHRNPKIGICEDCGEEVYLDRFTCTCDNCGADYNQSGQRLAPRSQWGEETGEVYSDIQDL